MSEVDVKEIETACASNQCLNGATLQRRTYGQANDISAYITTPDGIQAEFHDLQGFYRWLSRLQPISRE
jgi:hypothetical protein